MVDQKYCKKCSVLSVHISRKVPPFAPPFAPDDCEHEWVDVLPDPDIQQWTSTQDKPDTSLSLLVIDLGDSCVVKVERGEWYVSKDSPSTYFITGEVKVLEQPFAAVRDAIDSQDKPVPRIERADVSGNERYRVVWNDSAYPIPVNVLDALSGVVGKPLPIYEPTEGKWERLNTHDWTQAKKDAGEAGYGINTHSFEEAVCPVKIWRYTRGGE